MTYAFEIKDGNGKISVYDNLKGYGSSIKGVGNSGAPINYPLSMSDALIFISPLSYPFTFGYFEMGTVGGTNYFLIGSNGVPFEYIIADVLPVKSGGYGISMYDNSGNVIFHGNNKYLNVDFTYDLRTLPNPTSSVPIRRANITLPPVPLGKRFFATSYLGTYMYVNIPGGMSDGVNTDVYITFNSATSATLSKEYFTFYDPNSVGAWGVGLSPLIGAYYNE